MDEFLERITVLILSNANQAAADASVDGERPNGQVRYPVSWAMGMGKGMATVTYRKRFGEPPRWIHLLHPNVTIALMGASAKFSQRLPDDPPVQIPFPEPGARGVSAREEQAQRVPLPDEVEPWAEPGEWSFDGFTKLLSRFMGSQRFRSALANMLSDEWSHELDRWLAELQSKHSIVDAASEFEDEISNSIIEASKSFLFVAWENDDGFGPGVSGFFEVRTLEGVFFTLSSDYDQSGPLPDYESALWVTFASDRLAFDSEMLSESELLELVADLIDEEVTTSITVSEMNAVWAPGGDLKIEPDK